MSEKNIPLRKDIPDSDKWDLTALYADARECKTDVDKLTALTEKISSFEGHLADGPETLLEALRTREAAERTKERVKIYVNMHQYAGDDAMELITSAMPLIMYGFAADFFDRELCSMEDDTLQVWIQDKAFDDYRVYIQKLLHNRFLVLGKAEERFRHSATYDANSILDDDEMECGTVQVDGKEIPLTCKSYGELMENPDRAVRKEADRKVNAYLVSRADELASCYADLIEGDISLSRERRCKSSLEATLDKDNVPVSVYRNLISTVSANLAPQHKYYSIYKRVLALDELHFYDIGMPLVPVPEAKTSYEEAVEIVRSALSPLGMEYTNLLCSGLLGGWCDRYPNKGKKKGSWTFPSYDGHPLILLNYNEGDLYDLTDLAHEGGHAMHHWYSARSNPFMSWYHADFESEVASTFNEVLLFQYLMKNAKDDAMKKQLLFQRVSFIRRRLYGITMDAEFELAAHEAGEAGKPLTAGSFRALSQGLMKKYYGPEMVLDEYVDIDGLTDYCLYQDEPFHAYRYAIGMVAALALAKKVTEGGPADRDAYLNFLKSGGSHFPLENLRSAGVDMETDEPFQAACDTFRSLVDQLDALL